MEQDKKIIYLDSNIFIFALIDSELNNKNALALLYFIAQGNVVAYTCSLTLDEFLWISMKTLGTEDAVLACRALMDIPNLKILKVDKTTILKSLDFVSRGLKPRDSIHLAAMALQGIKEVVTQDSDFNKISEIDVFSLEHYLQTSH